MIHFKKFIDNVLDERKLFYIIYCLLVLSL